MKSPESSFPRSWLFIALHIALITIYSAPAAYSQSSANEVYKKASPAVVLIKTDKGTGTGFIVASNGVIVTALHVLEGASKIAVKIPSGDVFDDISLLAKDERRDLAILKVSGFELPIVNLGNSNDLKPGDRVIVIGNPLGAEELQTTIGDGIVSGIRDLGDGYKVIQVTAPISPGNSGGPALSANGDAIGVVVFRLREGQSLNFAVPINYVRGMLESIDSTKPLAVWKNAPGPESVLSQERSRNPVRWKSLNSPAIRILRFDGEHIYIEVVLSDEDHKLDLFKTGEVKRQGDKYVGMNRRSTVWWQTNPYTGEKIVTHRCVVEEPLELTLVTPHRIEGRLLTLPNNAKWDYKKCKSSKVPEWQTFAWIPE